MTLRARAEETSGTLGYGLADALNHLAVNLLVVIAVVGVVVWGASLPIVERSLLKATYKPSPAESTPVVTPAFTLASLEGDLHEAQAKLQATQARLMETQRRIQRTAAVQSPSFSLARVETEDVEAPTESTCVKTPLTVPSTSAPVCPSDQPMAP